MSADRNYYKTDNIFNTTSTHSTHNVVRWKFSIMMMFKVLGSNHWAFCLFLHIWTFFCDFPAGLWSGGSPSRCSTMMWCQTSCLLHSTGLVPPCKRLQKHASDENVQLSLLHLFSGFSFYLGVKLAHVLLLLINCLALLLFTICDCEWF